MSDDTNPREPGTGTDGNSEHADDFGRELRRGDRTVGIVFLLFGVLLLSGGGYAWQRLAPGLLGAEFAGDWSVESESAGDTLDSDYAMDTVTAPLSVDTAAYDARAAYVYLYNLLALPLSLAVDGSAYGTLDAGDVVELPVSGSVRVRWSTVLDEYGPDNDLRSGTITLSPYDSPVNITNVVDGAVYFTPVVESTLDATVSIGLSQGSTMRCIGYQTGVSRDGFTYGYYRLDATTTVSYFAGDRCQGTSLLWSNEVLRSNIEDNSGVVRLLVDRLPRD